MASWRVAAAGVRRPVCQGGLRLEGAQRGSVRVAEQVSERVRALLPCGLERPGRSSCSAGARRPQRASVVRCDGWRAGAGESSCRAVRTAYRKSFDTRRDM